MSKRELMEENKRLRTVLKEIEDLNTDYGNELNPCRSEQCFDCRFAVTAGGNGWFEHRPVLVGCRKGIICDDFQPLSRCDKQ